MTPPSSPHFGHRQPRSSPASPAPSKKGKRHQSASPIRHILNSPLLNRRQRKKQPVDNSSDEETTQNQSANNTSTGTLDEKTSKQHYRDLETFQKAQLRQKVSDSEYAFFCFLNKTKKLLRMRATDSRVTFA